MFHAIFRRLWGAKRKKPATRPRTRPRPRRLCVESLESRSLLSATPLTNVSDGNFAAPALAPPAYAYNPTGSPWQFSVASGVSGDGSSFTSGNAHAPSGTQVAFIQNLGTISQQVYLNAGVYNVTFEAAQRGNIQSQPQTINVLIDGGSVGQITPASYQANLTPAYTYGTYQSNNFIITTAGVHTLLFQGMSPWTANSTAFLSSVSIVPVIDSLADGSFEEPVLAPNSFTAQPQGTAWQFTPGAGISRNGSAFQTDWQVAQNAPQGSEVGYIQSNASMSQTVYLDAGEYQVSMFATQRQIWQSHYQEIEVLFDGMLEGTITPINDVFMQYQSLAFTATAGVHTITLKGLDPLGGGNTAFVDAVTLSRSNSINDGTFEVPSLATNSYVADPTGTSWQFAGNSGISYNGSVITAGNSNTPDGYQVGYIQNGASLTQSVYLVAGVYNLSMLAAQRTGQAQTQTIAVEVDGVTVGSITPTSTNYTTYDTENFTVASGAHTIVLQGMAPSAVTSTALIDEVTMSPVIDALVNGGFESPVLPANQSQADPTDAAWQFSGSSGIAANGSAYTTNNGNAPVGAQVAFITNTASMSQQVYLDAGGYDISFLAAQRANAQTAPQEIEVLVDGNVVGQATPTYSYQYVTYETQNFAVTAGIHTIEFLGLNQTGGSVTALIDQVSIAPAENGISQNTQRNVYTDAISDPSFESPLQTLNGYQAAPNGTPWQFTGSAGVASNGSAWTGGNNPAPSGQQVAYIQDTSSISQSVYLDAGLYNVTFMAAQRAISNKQAQQIAVLVDGVQVSVITPVATYIAATSSTSATTNPATYYAPYLSANFAVTAGMHTITFQGLAPWTTDATALIDAVAVNNANGVNNGNFELPVMARGTYSYDTAGATWQFAGSAGISTNASAFTINNTKSPDGNQVAFLQQSGSMSQSDYLTAGDYSVSFMAAQRGSSQSSYEEVEVLVDGIVEALVRPTAMDGSGGPGYGQYQTSIFSVTTGYHTIEFLGVNPNGGDNTVLIDSVTV